MNINDIEHYFLSSKDTIEQAINKLDAVQAKLILVVKFDKTLLGTITDGDIRRALLRHLPLSTALSQVMNCTPKCVKDNEGELKAKQLMRTFDIPAVPKLKNGKVIDLLGINKNTQKRHNPVFLMAGGFGKRLRPLTDNCPKPMLKVGDKPILENIIEQFIISGFYNFYISTHYLNEQIEQYFGDGSRFGINIQYINEEFPLGTAGAIALLPNEVKNEHLIMMNGDLLTQVKFDDMLDYHINERADISVAVRDYQIQVPFGVIKHSQGSITEIKEKPVESYFINAGIYCISPTVLQSVKSNKVLDMPTLIEQQLTKKNQVSMFPIHEYWLDIGHLNDFERAQTDILKLNKIA
ncbi:nucleotidyltransferase family protein [Bermanella sp. WJH001]|uniref:nucleotidyltransferase family protein n=1 Tax=Bermanella sp. WJH001 TaxID=3048005 RepID=UPI0024BDD4C7|nr:nucleotidyltransferase family protein [Bermanella sp. WJH001]MDJ1537771.1 nucleotidyltransferase family protein [Bermanella sp. WJH001]